MQVGNYQRCVALSLFATALAVAGPVFGATHNASIGVEANVAGKGGSATQAIDAGAVSAIDAGAVSAIDAGAVSAIDAGAVSAIDAGAVSAIDAGAVSAIDAGAVSAIDAGAVSAIDAGAVFAIDAGAISAIDAGAILAIDAGAISAIDAGAVSAIDAGAVSAIDAGAVSAIDAGAVSAIDAGAVAAIDAGSVAAIDAGAVRGIDQSSFSSLQQLEFSESLNSSDDLTITLNRIGYDVVTIATVDAVSYRSNQIVVLGTAFTVEPNALTNITVGSQISLLSQTDDPLSLPTSFVQIRLHQPIDTVSVNGVVSSVSATKMTVSGFEVDISAYLHRRRTITAGSAVSVTGYSGSYGVVAIDE